MTPHAVNPMYALCLLAAICVRQQIQSRVSQPLTKGVSLKIPTLALTKPNKASLKTVVSGTNSQAFTPNARHKILIPETLSNTKETTEKANSLVSSVINFAKKAQKVVGDFQFSKPLKQTYKIHEHSPTYSVAGSFLHVCNNIGVKWGNPQLIFVNTSGIKFPQGFVGCLRKNR